MKTETILVTQRERFATDSARKARAMEKFRLLNEATLAALRRAGLEREQRELAALALRETPTPYQTQTK